MSILSINDLVIKFAVEDGIVHAVNNISLELNQNEILGIVGESGSGKSQTVLAIMGLLANNALISGSIKFNNQELLGISKAKLNKIRGNEIAMIFQDPMTALNPYLNIQTQLIEPLLLHRCYTKSDAIAEAIRMLDFVKIHDARNKLKCYPHQLSGGMLQRVMIAMALLTKPKILIADEPTTALDVTVQTEILDLINQLKVEFNMATILISHDIGVILNVCDRVNVMYAGSIMERANVHDIFYKAKHPYTKALLKSIPNQESDILYPISGEPPNLLKLPNGCPFQERCENKFSKCTQGIFIKREFSNGHYINCNLDES